MEGEGKFRKNEGADQPSEKGASGQESQRSKQHPDELILGKDLNDPLLSSDLIPKELADMLEEEAAGRTSASEEQQPPAMKFGAVEESRLPRLLDSTGYETTRREIDFVGISEQDLADAVDRRRPLGMTFEQWDRCQAELKDALAKDGIDDFDVRLQGSGAHFYSTNPDKSFPQTVDEVKALVSAKVSLAAVERGIERYQQAGFGQDVQQPRDRFFDCLHGLSGRRKDRSDYDFQVSSDKLIARIEELERRHPERRYRSSPDEGGHWRFAAFRTAAPNLWNWAISWAGETSRKVQLVAFDRSGPPSHHHAAFSCTDWIVTQRRPD